jgi:DNA-binding response OmpR family regulator
MAFRVLLVDDDPDLLPSMVTLLEELSDFEIMTAENGREGLERIIIQHPDCVVIDVRMPELNGYQLVLALRGDPETADIPLIIMSALAQERDKWIGLAVGVDRYLIKPVDGSELIATIEEVTRRNEEDRISQLEALLAADDPAES